MASTDIRSPLAKARDRWLEANRAKIDHWAIEANTKSTYIENRLVSAFLDGAKAQEKIMKEQ